MENPEEARFCMSCAAPLHAEHAREQRKVVTVLFCDLVGSTALGESTDPEALRTRMRRYFEDLRVIIERHGGTVEKFVGDAVMAVFGIPVSHEDDALRAVRAASEMCAAIAVHGLEARIGVNTGEVVVGGESETLVTGDAVNVAARLEQAAASGEVLIGAETRLLVRDAVRVEAVDPLSLKGKGELVEAFRLLEVFGAAEALARHPDAPLIGRERERERLWRDFEDAVTERNCRLFTLLGPAGIGKSRLVAEFLGRAGGEADILHGRCLHYGEGITYWPLVEILIPLEVDPDSILGSSPEETQLAFRRLLEARAADRPQIVVLDDLQWAEPLFVDLLEHVADFSRDAAIFLLCVARTELLELRPGWGGGKVNATSILLEPLSDRECETLIENLLGDANLDAKIRDRIAAASEGNPLFVEEMLAMVRDQGGNGDIVVPPTIHALLQARLDTLGADERLVIERGAIEGRVFHRGAVAVLSPEPMRQSLGSHLATLIRKELIRPDRPVFPDDDAFRFRHLLIRDAAYESLPKATRAELHERFANWLAQHDLVERDEILGYHLEQACRYRLELDASDPALPELAARAADHLASAGRSALDRGDYNAGRALLRRAATLLPSGDEQRLALAPDLFSALWESGHRDEAREVLAEASAALDPVVRAIAAIRETIEFDVGGPTFEARQAKREKARVILEEAGHDEGLSLYWSSVAFEALLRCKAKEQVEACERSIAHAKLAGIERHIQGSMALMGGGYVFGPMPVSVALERMTEIQARAHGALAAAHVSAIIGWLKAMKGDVGRGRALMRSARQTYRDAGLVVTAGATAMLEASIAWRSGNDEASERLLREGLEELERIGEQGYAGTMALSLADCLYSQGRLDEAEHLCSWVRERSDADDVVNFVYLAGLEGLLLARRGHHEEGVRSARRAVELGETTDYFEARAWPRTALAETLALVGRMDEAAESGAQALAIYAAKGDITGAARVRGRLAGLGIEVG